MRHFYLSRNVSHLWLKGHHVNWKTGQPDQVDLENNRMTHCNGFVCATCQKMNVYLPHLDGANVVFDWLKSKKGKRDGWQPVVNENRFDDYFMAQHYANIGYVTVAVYENEEPYKPGHIAFVRPASVSCDEIKSSGPVLIQAGNFNSDSTTLRKGFRKHVDSWPEKKIRFFYYNEKPEL